MDVRDLAYLQEILSAGSVVDAAERVGRTAPALTKAVRRLEEEVGCPLFVRSGRGIEPTPAAHFLVDQTKGIARRLDGLRAQVKRMGTGQVGLVRIGVSATMAAIYLPQLLRHLSADYPDIRLNIVNGMNDVLRKGLREGELDLALGVFDEEDLGELTGFPIAADEVCVVAASSHPLQKQRLVMKDLLQLRWVLPTRAVKMRQWFDAAFVARGLTPPRPHIESSSIAILETLIADSEFVAFVSSWKLNTRFARGSLAALDVPDLRMPRQFGLIWSELSPPSAAAALLIDHIKGKSAHILQPDLGNS